jgi:hypothetical protein
MREGKVMGNPLELVVSVESPSANPDKSVKVRRGMRVATVAGVALGLTVAGGAVAGAATKGSNAARASQTAKHGAKGEHSYGDHARPAAFGTVTSVGADTFTLTTHKGSTVTVNVTSATTYRDHDVKSPSFANVTKGEMVAVFGADTSGTVVATSVGIRGTGGDWNHGDRSGSRPAAFGKVASVGQSTFTVTTREGSKVTVNVTSATTYRDHDVTSPSFANIETGESVAVFGTETSGTVAATSVEIGRSGRG